MGCCLSKKKTIINHQHDDTSNSFHNNVRYSLRLIEVVTPELLYELYERPSYYSNNYVSSPRSSKIYNNKFYSYINNKNKDSNIEKQSSIFIDPLKGNSESHSKQYINSLKPINTSRSLLGQSITHINSLKCSSTPSSRLHKMSMNTNCYVKHS